ncbi:Disulfide bond formation protein B [Vibrio aerogenes CECT 7868]|uniref:Disulfide bond formation protein B n=1 Tax=Vibrio aerogenes CECT 7868 TaxID=1216006 RepID=A0A1M5X5F6_9VIBR|nr:disulfide bond formation protein DsbB [Vibrio aerogenes]SHH95055.1 Disulfide bond formation protein B [Vibrio aerogenes CECT 7868]
MTLITKLNQFSRRRIAWLILFLFVIFFELCALFFQHGMKLAPCVMCIYERIAMLGIAVSALVGLIAPENIIFRIAGLLGWGYTALRGFNLARQHVEYQLHPSPFATCDAFVQLPHWAPLDQWMPWMFKAYGDCSEISWQFLSLSMPQWLVIIFAANMFVASIFILVQLRKIH